MKNYINQFKLLLGITCVSALFTGCSDDFLKPDPLSLYEPTVTFNTVDGLNAALASADKALRAYWTNTEACDLMLPLMSEYLFSDLTVAGKTDDQLAFCDILTVGIILTRIVWSSFGGRLTTALSMPILLSAILIRWRDWMKPPGMNFSGVPIFIVLTSI
mgnify:CR=1 FL=1